MLRVPVILLCCLGLAACSVPDRVAPPVDFEASEREARIRANEDAAAPRLGDFPADPAAPQTPSRCIFGNAEAPESLSELPAPACAR